MATVANTHKNNNMTTKALPHTFTITTGDPSRDGHNQSDTTAFMSNRTLAEIKRSYAVAASRYNIDITKQCRDYEDSKVDKQYWTNAREAFKNVPELIDSGCLSDPDDCGYDADCAYVENDEFVDLWFQTAKLVDPELVWEEAPTGNDHFIGGYGLYY